MLLFNQNVFYSIFKDIFTLADIPNLMFNLPLKFGTIQHVF